MEWTHGEYLLSDDKRWLDLDAVCRLLNETYWAAGRPRSMIETGIEHSVCLGLFHASAQVGFCRAVTDFATFTWLCDVIIDPAHRGKGLGKWMVECLIEHPQLQTRSQVLATRDAHSLYERWGFERAEYMKRMPGIKAQPKANTSSCC